ncbi:hypothetical protein B0H34DRAFT_710202 [Crassisporium funariophilum]|nr:hypothetical protein B0H34DRAFT_710202 [Crassisporium funariophilum]
MYVPHVLSTHIILPSLLIHLHLHPLPFRLAACCILCSRRGHTVISHFSNTTPANSADGKPLYSKYAANQALCGLDNKEVCVTFNRARVWGWSNRNRALNKSTFGSGEVGGGTGCLGSCVLHCLLSCGSHGLLGSLCLWHHTLPGPSNPCPCPCPCPHPCPCPCPCLCPCPCHCPLLLFACLLAFAVALLCVVVGMLRR